MASQNLQTEDMCAVHESVVPILKKLKLNRTNKTAAVILKIIMSDEMIVVDEEYTECTTEELQDELPERQPRYIVYSYVHRTKDDRVTYPLFFIYYHPQGCKSELQMRYAGCVNLVQNLANLGTRVELTDKDDFTDDWLAEMFRLK